MHIVRSSSRVTVLDLSSLKCGACLEEFRSGYGCDWWSKLGNLGVRSLDTSLREMDPLSFYRGNGSVENYCWP